MDNSLLIQVFLSTTVAAVVGAIINGIINRKKLGAEATNIITSAATGVVERLEIEIGRKDNRIADLERRVGDCEVAARQHDRDMFAIRATLQIHAAWDFRAIAAKHHATYLLVCPWFPEGTIYQSRNPAGFYADLMRDKVPGWLVSVTLNTGMTLPYQLYRIDYSAPGGEKLPQ